MWKSEDRLRLMPSHSQTEMCSSTDKVSEKDFCFYLLKNVKNMSGATQQEGRKYWRMRTFL